MLKLAYQLGVKLAFAEEQNPDANPADLLAQLLQEMPEVPEVTEDTKDKKAIGEPDDQEVNYGSRMSNFSFDTLGQLGLEVQGPATSGL
jgi:hypothetical protein